MSSKPKKQKSIFLDNMFYIQGEYKVVICPCGTELTLNAKDFKSICKKYNGNQIFIDPKDHVAKIKKSGTNNKILVVLEREIFGPKYSYKSHKTDFTHKETKKYDNWCIEPNGITLATISSCITDDKGQTMQELIKNVAKTKGVPTSEAKIFLEKLYADGRLGYYQYSTTEHDYIFHKWIPSDRKGQTKWKKNM